MNLAILIIVSIVLLIALRVWWLTQDTKWHLSALYEKVDLIDMDIRYIHTGAVPAGENWRYPAQSPRQTPRRSPL